MKKYFLLLMASACISVADAQLIKQNEEQKKQADLDWYNCSFDKDGVYGAEVNKAYDFLKEEKIKKKTGSCSNWLRNGILSMKI